MAVEQKPIINSSNESESSKAVLSPLKIKTIFQNAAWALHDEYLEDAKNLLASADFSDHFKKMFKVPDGENATEFVLKRLQEVPDFREELKNALQKYSLFLD